MRTIGIKGPRCLDVAEAIAQIVGREESRQLTDEYYETDVQMQSHVEQQVRRSVSELRWDSRAMQCPSCRFENMPGLDVVRPLRHVADVWAPPRSTCIRPGPRRPPSGCAQVFPRGDIYQARDTASRHARPLAGSIIEDSRDPPARARDRCSG